jgi:hypothetical protein
MDATAKARLLAVEVLLAEPELLGNDALETDLYILRDQLQEATAVRSRLTLRPLSAGLADVPAWPQPRCGRGDPIRPRSGTGHHGDHRSRRAACAASIRRREDPVHRARRDRAAAAVRALLRAV